MRRPTEPLPVRGIFETHLTVSDLDRSVAFYRDIVGLPLAMALPERGAAFFWVTEPGKAMIGLWSLGSAPIGLSLHVAFTASVADVSEYLVEDGELIGSADESCCADPTRHVTHRPMVVSISSGHIGPHDSTICSPYLRRGAVAVEI